MEERETESGSLLSFDEMEKNRDLGLKIDGMLVKHGLEIERVFRRGFVAVAILERWRARRNGERESASEREGFEGG